MSLLPQFPLKLVVFPSEDLNLHIFEDRYKELVQDCYESGTPFGIPSVIKENQYSFGTSVEIKEIVKKYEDGKMDIKTKGKKVYKILSLENPIPGKLYGGAEVMYIDNHDDSDPGMNKTIIDKIEELYSIMGVEKTVDLNPKSFRTYQLAHKIGLSYEQEINLRELMFESEKQIFILNHFEAFIPNVLKMEDMRKKVKMNGHFKDLRSYEL